MNKNNITSHFLSMSLSAILLMYCGVSSGQALIYEDDPAIVKQINALQDNQSMYLPLSKLDGKVFSPRHRDFSNKMPYAVDRQTAFYAGGSHQTYRANDVWEFHLGSNKWHRLFAPDGGNHAFLKYILSSGVVKKLNKQPPMPLSSKDKKKLKEARKWWNENILLKDGHITTLNGGPIMPSHTWDAITYDSTAKRLLWSNGAQSEHSRQQHAALSGTPLDEISPLFDPDYKKMWMFDPYQKQWIHYKTKTLSPHLRGMGASLQYLPDIQRTIWYVAAQNVTPHAFEMWIFDNINDIWTELKPNKGKTISTLAKIEKQAPLAEQQVAYDAKSQTLVAVRGPDVFAYSVPKNEWRKIATDNRIVAHDAKSVFGYDEKNRVFLLANPKNSTQLAAFSLTTNQWQVLTPDGPPVPNQNRTKPRGYFDPTHNVFVIDDSKGKVWVYRFKRDATVSN